MEKGIFVKDISPNTDFEGIFIVENSALAESRNGPYWRLLFSDASGSAEAKIWFPLSAKFQQIENGVFAAAKGRAQTYRDQLQLVVEQLEILDDAQTADCHISDFMPSSPYDIDEMYAELKQACLKEFTHGPWRKFVLNILNNDKIKNALRTCPAAKSIHQAYAGGLLEHSLAVFKICRSMCGLYPELDRQTLLAAAILHDIGKIREFTGGLANDYSDEGRLMGHIMLGMEIVTPFLEKSGLDNHLKDHFKHLLLSHHGQREYGAPCLPQTAEAFVLHFADNMDARLAQCRTLFDGMEDAPQWSAWQRALDRSILNPVRTPRRDCESPKKPEQAGPQCLSLLKE